MSQSAESAKRFVQKLWQLTEELTEDGIVVASLHAEWGHFGCWSLEAQRAVAADAYADALLNRQWDTPGPDVLRVVWDGRERILMVDTAKTPPLSSPGPWSRDIDKAFDDSDLAIRFVREHLGRWVRDGKA